MARVSVDDTVWRGPREVRLRRVASKLAGRDWSQRELVGTLVAVWSICYDQVSVEISIEDVDTAAELDGFAAALVECNLARRAGKFRINVAGAAKHVAYLLGQSENGKKSGGVRRKKTDGKHAESSKEPSKLPSGYLEGSLKLRSGDLEASRNHSLSPDTAPDTAPDKRETPPASPPAPSLPLELVRPEPEPTPPSGPKRKRRKAPMPDGWTPREPQAQQARALGLDVAREADKFRIWTGAVGQVYADWDLGFANHLDREADRPGRKLPVRDTSPPPSTAPYVVLDDDGTPLVFGSLAGGPNASDAPGATETPGVRPGYPRDRIVAPGASHVALVTSRGSNA